MQKTRNRLIAVGALALIGTLTSLPTAHAAGGTTFRSPQTVATNTASTTTEDGVNAQSRESLVGTSTDTDTSEGLVWAGVTAKDERLWGGAQWTAGWDVFGQNPGTGETYVNLRSRVKTSTDFGSDPNTDANNAFEVALGPGLKMVPIKEELYCAIPFYVGVEAEAWGGNRVEDGEFHANPVIGTALECRKLKGIPIYGSLQFDYYIGDRYRIQADIGSLARFYWLLRFLHEDREEEETFDRFRAEIGLRVPSWEATIYGYGELDFFNRDVEGDVVEDTPIAGGIAINKSLGSNWELQLGAGPAYIKGTVKDVYPHDKYDKFSFNAFGFVVYHY